MSYEHITIPAEGQAITANEDLSLNVPDDPIIPFIEGDGIGVDISPVMIKVVDAAVEKAYQGNKKIAWMEIYAGEKRRRFMVKTNGYPTNPWPQWRNTLSRLKAL